MDAKASEIKENEKIRSGETESLWKGESMKDLGPRMKTLTDGRTDLYTPVHVSTPIKGTTSLPCLHWI